MAQSALSMRHQGARGARTSGSKSRAHDTRTTKSQRPKLLPTPIELRGHVFEVEGRRLAVLTFLRPRRWAGDLTESEYEVAVFVLSGRTNAEIASARNVSVRTVANQVAGIFRKLGVSSRGELVAKFATS